MTTKENILGYTFIAVIYAWFWYLVGLFIYGFEYDRTWIFLLKVLNAHKLIIMGAIACGVLFCCLGVVIEFVWWIWDKPLWVIEGVQELWKKIKK